MEQNDLIDIRRFVNRNPDVALQKLAVAFRGSIQSVEKSIEELKQIKTVFSVSEFDQLLGYIEAELSFEREEEIREENKVKIAKVKTAFGK